MAFLRYGYAECVKCDHRWYVRLGPKQSADWLDCPECGEQARMVKYVSPPGQDE